MTALFLSYLPSLFAVEVPKRPEGYVSDYARLLTPEAKFRLEETLRRFETETSNQIVVVTFPSLEGEVLEDFSIRLAESWKIGQKGKDNGVILLIFKEDRAVRMEVGYGLEGVLTDALSKLIIANEIVPRFREGKFDEGIEKAVQAIQAATRGEYQPGPRTDSFNGAFLLNQLFFSVVFGFWFSFPVLRFLFGLGVLLMVVGLLSAWPSLVFPSIFFLAFLPLALHLLLRRMGNDHSVLGRQGYRSRDSILGPWGGGFGGGGFGGGGFSGGGGSFGGGGASGRW